MADVGRETFLFRSLTSLYVEKRYGLLFSVGVAEEKKTMDFIFLLKEETIYHYSYVEQMRSIRPLNWFLVFEYL